jgi:hypothetical protein
MSLYPSLVIGKPISELKRDKPKWEAQSEGVEFFRDLLGNFSNKHFTLLDFAAICMLKRK